MFPDLEMRFVCEHRVIVGVCGAGHHGNVGHVPYFREAREED